LDNPKERKEKKNHEEQFHKNQILKDEIKKKLKGLKPIRVNLQNPWPNKKKYQLMKFKIK
jgi:hypothetical protein